MDAADRPVLSRTALAVATSIATFAFGAAISYGALEHSVGWGERGPETGYFPFRLGILVMLASLATAVEAFWLRSAN